MSETSKFTEDILTAAKEKSEQVVSEAETETQHAFEEAKSHLSREADDIIHNAQTEAEAVRRRAMSEVRHRLKLREQVEKSKILSEALEATRKHVTEIVNDESKYLPYLAGYIEAGIRALGLENVTVHLNATDLKRIDAGKLEREIAKLAQTPVRIEWSKQPIESLGGAVISSKDGKTRIVNTFDERFEALESKLLMEAGKLLFGE
jgi:V/A-type H+/Na+-transporting ATPase subunit E